MSIVAILPNGTAVEVGGRVQFIHPEECKGEQAELQKKLINKHGSGPFEVTVIRDDPDSDGTLISFNDRLARDVEINSSRLVAY